MLLFKIKVLGLLFKKVLLIKNVWVRLFGEGCIVYLIFKFYDELLLRSLINWFCFFGVVMIRIFLIFDIINVDNG